MPYFNGIDPVPMGNLAGRQQKIDCGRDRPITVSHRISKGLAIMAALRAGLQIQEPDAVVRRHWRDKPQIQIISEQNYTDNTDYPKRRQAEFARRRRFLGCAGCWKDST